MAFSFNQIAHQNKAKQKYEKRPSTRGLSEGLVNTDVKHSGKPARYGEKPNLMRPPLMASLMQRLARSSGNFPIPVLIRAHTVYELKVLQMLHCAGERRRRN